MADKSLRTGLILLLTVAIAGCPSTQPPAKTPTVNTVVATQAAGPVNQSAMIVFAVSFDQAVSGFDDAAADVQLVHNGTAGGQTLIIPIDAKTYAVTVTGVTGDGSFQLTIPAGIAQDATGVTTAAATSSAVLVDNTPPQAMAIVSQTASGRYGLGASIDVTVQFSEPVTLAGGTMTVTLNMAAPVAFQPFAGATSVSGAHVVAAGDNVEPLDAVGISLADGAKLTDAAGNVAQIAMPATTIKTGQEIIIDTAGPAVTVKKMLANSLAKLAGTVNDPSAAVSAVVAGVSYPATNNGDGTWSLSDAVVGTPLPVGTYDVTVTAVDTVGNVGSDTVTGALTIDATPPVVIVTRLTVNDHTPTLTGAVDDPTAVVTVTVGGQTHTAVNNKNGTWTLDGSRISPLLPSGTYDVTVEATDPAGNVGRDSTTDELTIL